MSRIGLLQEILDRYGIRPTYVVDFPVAAQPEGFEPLKQLLDDDRCDVGAHLHPWVNPPFVEELSNRNSFGCHLGADVEFDKIRLLRSTISANLRHSPAVFKAGRYGFGATTAAAIEALGFDIDVSVNPRMDFRPVDGPSFESFDARPFFFGQRRRLLEIPCSTDYIGAAGNLSHRLHRAISSGSWNRAHVPGALARLGIVNKVMLSPEGATAPELRTLTRSLYRRGVRTFSLTLHSPSLQPGCTPYVGSARELRDFLDRIDSYCEFFLAEMSGRTATPRAFLSTICSQELVR